MAGGYFDIVVFLDHIAGMKENIATFWPASWPAAAKRIVDALSTMDKVIVSAHVSPDGDAVASLAAAGHVLRALGKEFVLYSYTGIPAYLNFVPLPGIVRTSLSTLPFTPKAGLWLDCNVPGRLGKDLATVATTLPSVIVDHHELPCGHETGNMGNLGHWIVPEAAATAHLMACVASAAGLPLAGELANALMVGLVTDTGGFHHANTSPEVLQLVAHLVTNGVNISDIRNSLDNCWSWGHFRLWARLMDRVQCRFDGKLAFCVVRLEDLQQCQALKDDLEGFVEQMRRLAGVKVTLLLREDAPGYWKFSLRSSGNVNVQQVAAGFGGGGHMNAAGGNVTMAENDAVETLCTAIKPVVM